MPLGFEKSHQDKLAELLARAQILYDQNALDDAEEVWCQAVSFAQLHEDSLLGLLVIEAIAFGEKQSLFCDFDLAKAKFELALRLMAADPDCPDVLIAMAYSKCASNEMARGRDEEAMGCFKLAANHFAKADDFAGLELGYAECLHQFGRTLQTLKEFTAAVDALEKALTVYKCVQDLPDGDRQLRFASVRNSLIQCVQLARGAQKGRLQKQVESAFGHPVVASCSFKRALEAFQKEGFAKALTLETAKRLVPECERDEESGNWTLLEVLRKFYAEADGADATDLLVYAQPKRLEEVDAIMADLSARLGEEPAYRVLSWNNIRFSQMVIATADGEEGIVIFKGIEVLVQFYNLRLQKRNDERRFFALDAGEDEAVYLLMSIDVQKRLAQACVVPFVGMYAFAHVAQ